VHVSSAENCSPTSEDAEPSQAPAEQPTVEDVKPRSSLPDIKGPGSSLPSLTKPREGEKWSMASMSAEDMQRLERKEQKRKEKEKRAKEQALLAKKAKELQEASSAVEVSGGALDPEVCIAEVLSCLYIYIYIYIYI
jgi:hypothetical protein